VARPVARDGVVGDPQLPVRRAKSSDETAGRRTGRPSDASASSGSRAHDVSWPGRERAGGEVTALDVGEGPPRRCARPWPRRAADFSPRG
jgi:hypothetical protein